jgi:biopolymer transport protein ExbB
MRQDVVLFSTHAALRPVRRCLRAGLLAAGLLWAGTVAAQETPLPPPPSPNVEQVVNPYGIEALWHEGDWVARGTLLVLLVMSAGSWYIGIVKLIEQAQLMRDARRTRTFWQAPSIAEGVSALREESPFRYIAEEGLNAVAHHEGTLVEQIELVTWIGMSIQHAHDIVNSRLQGGLAFLATVGSTAPFVGLFGTVWGIYHALTAIGIAGQASIDKVAGPVGEALIMTAFGLAVAVPAVLGYNWLVRRNKVAMELVRHFSNEVHMALLGKPDRRAAKAG